MEYSNGETIEHIKENLQMVKAMAGVGTEDLNRNTKDSGKMI